jgi:hypothetical protein
MRSTFSDKLSSHKPFPVEPIQSGCYGRNRDRASFHDYRLKVFDRNGFACFPELPKNYRLEISQYKSEIAVMRMQGLQIQE